MKTYKVNNQLILQAEYFKIDDNGGVQFKDECSNVLHYIRQCESIEELSENYNEIEILKKENSNLRKSMYEITYRLIDINISIFRIKKNKKELEKIIQISSGDNTYSYYKNKCNESIGGIVTMDNF